MKCGKCKRRPAEIDGRRCAICRTVAATKRARYRAKQRESGNCRHCSQKAVDKGLCQKHRDLQKTERVKLKEAGICYDCRITKTPDGRCGACRKRRREQYLQLKIEVFNKYGGCKCACPGCPEKSHELKFLTIDHVDNNGGEHRRMFNIKSMCKWLKVNRYPSGYQVLCFNCNIGKHLNNGICPHLNQ